MRNPRYHVAFRKELKFRIESRPYDILTILTMYEIRKARPSDAARVRSIALAAYAKYVERIGRPPAPMLADYTAEVTTGRALVIETDGTIVGYIICKVATEAYHIENVAVDPAHQGEGYGRRLIDRAVLDARVAGLNAVRLYTNAAMTENLSLYRHMGFVETHRAI